MNPCHATTWPEVIDHAIDGLFVLVVLAIMSFPFVLAAWRNR